MSAIDERAVADLLLEAAETHHRVYRITDGEDPDWASWYADWLIRHSELPELLHRTPVRSELVYLLVLLAKEVEDQPPPEPWEQHYARRLADHFAGDQPAYTCSSVRRYSPTPTAAICSWMKRPTETAVPPPTAPRTAAAVASASSPPPASISPA